MENSEIREKVKDLYNNPTWSDRVDRMSDKQVFAVYNRQVVKGRLWTQ